MSDPTQSAETVFAQRMREQRTTVGISQAQLAQRLRERGVRLDQSALARIESGDRSVRLGEAVAVADALSATVSGLLRPADRLYEQVDEAERAHTDAVRALEHWNAQVKARQAALDYLRERLDETEQSFKDYLTESMHPDREEGGDGGQRQETP